uniref:excalibur calcium-binding domain-containing protein n=1 Tax=Sporosarcina sp. FSL K6-1522 TaxID=2921554 RepID=UPI00406C30E0
MRIQLIAALLHSPIQLLHLAFQNCTELRKKYPNGVASDHPAYSSKHDRDKDGYACER